MAEAREYGDIATKLLLENDRVRIWEMRLEPGERSALHRHDNDYIMIQIDGDRMAALAGARAVAAAAPGAQLPHLQQALLASAAGRPR